MRRADGVVSDVIDGCAYLIGPAGTHLVELNRTGTAVWDSLAVDRDIASIVELVQEAFSTGPVTREQVHHDVTAFLDELSHLGLTAG